MNKKEFGIILVFSVILTYGATFVDEIINVSKNTTGLPFGFASLNFMGGSTNNITLILDIIFWFAVIFGIWKLLQKVLKK